MVHETHLLCLLPEHSHFNLARCSANHIYGTSKVSKQVFVKWLGNEISGPSVDTNKCPVGDAMFNEASVWTKTSLLFVPFPSAFMKSRFVAVVVLDICLQVLIHVLTLSMCRWVCVSLNMSVFGGEMCVLWDRTMHACIVMLIYTFSGAVYVYMYECMCVCVS